MKLGDLRVKKWQTWIFRENFFLRGKVRKYTQNRVLCFFAKNLIHWGGFFSRLNGALYKNRILGKIWFSSYNPKHFRSIQLQDFLNLKYLRRYSSLKWVWPCIQPIRLQDWFTLITKEVNLVVTSKFQLLIRDGLFWP